MIGFVEIRLSVIRFSVTGSAVVVRSIPSAGINDHDRSRGRRIVDHNNRSRSRGRRRRRHRTAVEIGRPCRRNRAITCTAPFPGAMIPVPVLIPGDPSPFPPVITVFRDHDHRCRCRHDHRWRRRRWYHISLLRREKDIIQITEKDVDSAGIFAVVDMPPRHMRFVTGASGKDAPGQSSRNCFEFMLHLPDRTGFLLYFLRGSRRRGRSDRRSPESVRSTAASRICRHHADGGR